MKKTFKRAGVAVLSMAMLLSMGAVGAMTASAYTGDNGGLTVTSTASEIKAYKVAEFTAGSWSWLAGIDTVTATDMQTVISSSDNADALKTIANKLATDTHLGVGTSLTAGTETELAPGYYLVISKGAGKLYQNKLIEVKKNTAATLTNDKSTPVTVTKTITGVTGDGGVIASTDSKKASADDQAIVTYSIVTDIPTYSDKATITNMADYVIVDDYDDAFSDITISSVTIDTTSPTTLTQVLTEAGISGTENAGKYYYVNDTTSANHTFTVKVNKKSILDNGGKHVTIVFTAKLNSDGRANYEYPNDVDFTYDNTFNATGGTDTLENEADVYSVPIDIYKYYMDSSTKTAITSADAVFKLTNTTTNTEYSATTDATGYAAFTTLPAGTYDLTETAAPAGFKKLDGTIATLVVSVDTDGAVSVEESGTDLTKHGVAFNREVANTPQENLPGTGGMGTVLFTVGGAAIVMLAGVLFVAYMRKRKNEE